MQLALDIPTAPAPARKRTPKAARTRTAARHAYLPLTLLDLPTTPAPAPAAPAILPAPRPALKAAVLSVREPAPAPAPAPLPIADKPVMFVGAPEPSWLTRFAFPMLVSRARLSRLKMKLPKANAPWILDSAGFKHIEANGRWLVSAEEYAEEVQRWMDAIGLMVAAAPQDWMCEEHILAKTGKTVREHQRLTVENFLRLRELAPDVPWMPVLQGWLRSDYIRHIEMYTAAGIDLREQPHVGVGSICRRQSSIKISLLLGELARMGLRLHGFGVKLQGLQMSGEYLTTVDSAAWSFHARAEHDMLTGCAHPGGDCRNCPLYAQDWHARIIERGLATWPKGFHPATTAHLN